MIESPVLGSIIGIFLIICGLLSLIKRKDLIEIVGDLENNPAVIYFLGLPTLAIGLVIVIIHPVWIMDWPVIITIFGWAMILESIAYMILPHKKLIRWIGIFNNPAWYNFGGTGSMIISLYLTIMSFKLVGI